MTMGGLISMCEYSVSAQGVYTPLGARLKGL